MKTPAKLRKARDAANAEDLRTRKAFGEATRALHIHKATCEGGNECNAFGECKRLRDIATARKREWEDANAAVIALE